MNIREYIGYSKELTAEQVKKLPVGSKVTLNSFDRRGNHVALDLTVTQSGKSKILTACDFYGNKIEKKIRKETERFCYTEAEQ